MIHVLHASRSWVKGVESDGTQSSPAGGSGNEVGPGNGLVGNHIWFEGCYRCVCRDSYMHHANTIVQGGTAYGFSVSRHASANLIENNIIRWLNKPFTFRASGGGNVVGYNYIDDAW